MATNIEIEVKSLLSKKDYESVLAHFNLDLADGYIQKNYYIDTKDYVLRKMGLSLRIRKLNGYIMTLKLPMAEGLLEKSQNITREQFLEFQKKGSFPEGTVYDFIESLYVAPEKLVVIASLSTLRIEVPYKDSILAVDENRYGDQQDYELEMEATAIRHARKLLAAVCEDVGIPFVENTISKQKRAIMALLPTKNS